MCYYSGMRVGHVLVFLSALLLPGATGASAAAADWPLYGKDLANSRDGGPAGPSPEEVAGIREAWRHEISDGDVTGTPVVADGTLVVGSSGGSVVALDAVTGKLRWSRDLDQPINASAAIAPEAGLVYVALAQPHGPRLVALRLDDGTVVWDTTLDTQAESDTYGSPVVWDGRVYAGISAFYGEFSEDSDVSVRGSVVALDAQTGAVDWKTYMVPPGHDGGSVWSTPAIDPQTGRLFVGTGNAYHEPAADTTDSVVALDARSGALLDHFQATANDVWTLANPEGPDFDFGASPNLFTTPDGRKLVGEGQKSGIYWALDRTTLDPVWQTRVGPGSAGGGVIGSTAFDENRVYGPINALAGPVSVWSISRAGENLWSSPEPGPANFSPVTVANGVVYFADFTLVVTARDAGTGELLAKLPLGAPSWAGVSVVGEAVYAAVGTSRSPSGAVVAFGDTSRSGARRREVPTRRPRLRLRVRPRRVAAGRQTVFVFRVTRGSRPVRGARVRFAGIRVRTGPRGRARIVVSLPRAGRYPARALKPGMRPGLASILARRGL